MRKTRFVLACLLACTCLGPANAAEPVHRPLVSLLARLETRRVDMRTALDLWQLQSLWDFADTAARKRILTLLRRIEQGRATPLPLKRMAGRLLAARLRAAGQPEAHRAKLDRQGFIRDWWLMGPFDNEGHAGYDIAFGPERSIDLEAVEPGKLRPVRWRRAPVQPADGRVLLHPLFVPQAKAVAYAFCIVHLPRPAKVLLHAGCDDGCKVWINGSLVLADPRVHPLKPDQHAVAMRLDRGYHRLLVKVAQDEGAWGFALTLTDARGRRPRGLELVTDRQEMGKILADRPPPPPTGVETRPTLASWFTERALRTPDDPRVLAEAAVALVQTGAQDLRRREVDDFVHRAIERLGDRPDASDLRLLLAATTEDDDLSRRLVREAGALAPTDPEPAFRLGLAHHVRNELEKAIRAHTRALAIDPDHLPSRLELAELLHALGLGGMAQDRIEAEVKRYPDVPEVLALAANLIRQGGMTRKAADLYETILRHQSDHQTALRALFEMASARGEIDPALAWLDKLLALDPSRLGWWLERGDLLLHNHRLQEAVTSYRRAVAIAPENPVALVRLGQALQALGRKEDCLEQWERALALSPQDRDLALHIESLRPRGEAFHRPFEVDARSLLENEPPLAGSDPQVAAVRLLDRTVVRLHPNGMSSRFRQQVIRLIHPRGADQEREFQIEYAPSRQQVRILRSRVIHPDGREDAGVLVADHSLSEPWYNLYYDVHAREITFPTLAAGDVLELTYLIDDVGSRSLLGDYFGDLVPFQFAEPARRIGYVLIAAADQPLHHHQPAGVRHQVQNRDDGTVVHSWEAVDMPGVEPEPSMPGFTETHAFLHVSSHQDWGELGRWYLGQIADPLVPGPEVKRLAASLTAGLQDPREKIRALYRFVADSTRYVGLEFGIHSYVPYRTSQVLERRFGDCKDKSALLVALLREAGFDAQVALVRMQHLGRVPDAPASLAVFNHAICHVPGQDLWLDATASFHDIEDLPAQDQDVPALVIRSDGGHLVRTPTVGAARNRTEISFAVHPSSDGATRVDARVEVTGSFAPGMRAQLASGTDRKATIEKFMNDLFPGSQVTSLEIENLNRPDRPLTCVAQLTVPLLTRAASSSLVVPALGRSTTYQKIFSPFQDRRHDLQLGPPWSVQWSVEHHIPDGYELDGIPAGDRIASSFGSAWVRYERAARSLRVEAEFRLTRNRVSAADYPAFRDFLGRVDRLFGVKLRLTRRNRDGS